MFNSKQMKKKKKVCVGTLALLTPSICAQMSTLYFLIWLCKWFSFFSFFLYILLLSLSRIMSRPTLYNTSFAGWKSISNHVNYCRVLHVILARGQCSIKRKKKDFPCTGGLQLTFWYKGWHTYLVSSLQMTLRKACSDTEIFPCLQRGSNPWPLALNR